MAGEIQLDGEIVGGESDMALWEEFLRWLTEKGLSFQGWARAYAEDADDAEQDITETGRWPEEKS